MTKRKILIIIITFIIIISTILGWRYFRNERDLDYQLATVIRGDISQKISEIGAVRVGKEINLGFQGTGRIKEIHVEIGEIIEKGTLLAEIDTEHLEIQLSGAKAGLSSAETKLAKLLAGASEEEIRIAEGSVDSIKNYLKEFRRSAEKDIDSAKAGVSSTQVALINANQNLVNVKNIADNSLKTARESALNVLRNANLKLNNTFNVIDLIQRTYFVANDQEGIKVRIAEDQVRDALNRARIYLSIAKANPTKENVDIAVLKMREALETTSESLAIIYDISRAARHRYIVSSVSKTALDTEKAKVITVLTGVIGSQQAISSMRIGNEAKINSAETLVSSSERALISAQKKLAGVEARINSLIIRIEGELKIAQYRLALTQAKPRQEVIDFHQNQVAQAQAGVQFLKNQIQEANLYSPIDGKIVEINKEVGEIFIPGVKPFISLVSDIPFQVEVAIHEEDIVLIDVGNPVEIEIFAFPDQIFKGRIVSIKPIFDPAKKAAKRMVFYQVIIDFQEEVPKGLKLGMTGDVAIITDLRQNVLIIPEDAIFEEKGIKMVQVLEDGLVKNREVKIGFIGDDDIVEILSGLNEGEEIIKNPKDF